MTNQEENEYYNALATILNYESGQSITITDQQYKDACALVDNAEHEMNEEREKSYVQPHYPNAPEGSIWDY